MSTEDIDKNLIQGHEYDGIKELDNPLPLWWLFTFFATIIFGFIFFLHVTSLKITAETELAEDMAAIEKLQEKSGSNDFKADNSQLAALSKDSQALTTGKEHFNSKCAVCHGQEGQGLIGPNLTDHFWVLGQGAFAAVVNVIREGSAAKGMPPWKGIIPDEDILALAAYVKSLQGTKPENPRAPEGDEVKE